jgi:hypothetical protein
MNRHHRIEQKVSAISSRRALACLTILAALLLGGTAHADVTSKKAMWGPATVAGTSQFAIYEDLGVGVWQTNLAWNQIATRRPDHAGDPSDPAYAWPAELDGWIADAGSHGIGVSMLVMGTPRWANGGRAPRWAPERPDDFAQFLAAAARRYPAVRRWMIWGEPTKAANFQPLREQRGRRLAGRGLRGPRRYARMLDAAYGALKAVDRRNLVIGGNSFTTGTVRPRQWIQALRLPSGRPPRMDLYGHNPFSARPPLLSSDPLGFGYADFGDLDTLMKWLDRYLRKARPDGKRLKLFLSEYSLPTDHANFEFNFWTDRQVQADWIADALRETRRTRRIATFGYLGLYDDPVRPDGLQVERGLLERDGTRKPAYAAFRDG